MARFGGGGRGSPGDGANDRRAVASPDQAQRSDAKGPTAPRLCPSGNAAMIQGQETEVRSWRVAVFSESQRYAAGSKPAVGRLAARTAAWVCALATISGSVVPAIALAGAVDDAKALNAKGAGLFKKGEYFDAAVAFEKAYALDARDFRVLRYAGRSWQ